MSETDFSNQVCEGLSTISSSIHISKIESPLTSAGVPDLDVCVAGNEFKIELKYGSDSKMPKMRPSQVKWFRHRVKAGGFPWVFAKIIKHDMPQYMLIAGMNVKHLPNKPHFNDWVSLSEMVCQDPNEKLWLRLLYHMQRVNF